MTIREEFEKAFEVEFGVAFNSVVGAVGNGVPVAACLWAAKWMAERCAKSLCQFCANDIPLEDFPDCNMKHIHSNCINHCNAITIRTLASELES